PEAQAGEQLMHFTDLFIKRPVLAIVVSLVILIAGLQAIRSLSVRQYPRSDIAVVTVTTAYVGANADLVRGFITTPLERVIASADGIDYVESSSAQGVSTITVHLELNYDTNASMVTVNLVANTNLQTPADFRKLVVKEHNGDVVRLGDIADVVLGAENYEQDVRFDGKGATFMGIWVLHTANALEVIHSVREAIPGIQSQLPTGMKVGIPYDSTEYIQNAIHEVLKTLTETLLIVILVIFLFLGALRAVLIPVVAIPISLIGAIFLMFVSGFTINLLTLLAIVLSVGLVVD